MLMSSHLPISLIISDTEQPLATDTDAAVSRWRLVTPP